MYSICNIIKAERRIFEAILEDGFQNHDKVCNPEKCGLNRGFAVQAPVSSDTASGSHSFSRQGIPPPPTILALTFPLS